jgi:hypothetical protein
MRKIFAFLFLLFPAISYGQIYPGGQPPITTVAGLASYTTKGQIASVTNGNSATDCTVGGGSTAVLCQYSGSVWAAIAGGGTPSGSAAISPTPSSAYTFYPSSTTDCNTPSQTGTTICAKNSLTGAIDYSGTDAKIVIQSAVNNVSATCGALFFKQGTYNFNSLTQEVNSGYSNFYAIGIPPQAAAGQFCYWDLEGEPPPSDVGGFFTSAVQTAGVIFNLTSTAVSSVAAHSKIMDLWARPMASGGAGSGGAGVEINNIDFRVPTNQRGCETEVDMSLGMNTDIENIVLDTGVANGSLVFPVEDTCTAWGNSDAGGLVGLVTTNSEKNQNYLLNDNCWGADLCMDIRSEHTVMINSWGDNCNHAFDYGNNAGGGALIYYPSQFIGDGLQACAKGLTIGSNFKAGARLTVIDMNMEDGTGSFAPVYHFDELSPNLTQGSVSYNLQLPGGGSINHLLGTPFDGGGGGNFKIVGLGALSGSQALDSFTRPNSVDLGAAWYIFPPSGTGGLQIVSNAATVVGAGAASAREIYVGQPFYGNDQFSKLTVASIDSSSTTFATVMVNEPFSAATNTNYQYYCSHVAAGGSGIVALVAGVTHNLAVQTSAVGCNATDTIEIRTVTAPTGVLVYAFRNGIPDVNVNGGQPFLDASFKLTGGGPAFQLNQDTAAGVSATNWSGGNLPTLRGTDSMMANPEYATMFMSTGHSPTPTGTGACATITTQVPATTGGLAGTLKCTGTTGASTITLTWTASQTAPNGYRCSADDETTVADRPNQTSTTTTTCVLTTTATASNDVIVWNASPF